MYTLKTVLKNYRANKDNRLVCVYFIHCDELLIENKSPQVDVHLFWKRVGIRKLAQNCIKYKSL